MCKNYTSKSVVNGSKGVGHCATVINLVATILDFSLLGIAPSLLPVVQASSLHALSYAYHDLKKRLEQLLLE